MWLLWNATALDLGQILTVYTGPVRELRIRRQQTDYRGQRAERLRMKQLQWARLEMLYIAKFLREGQRGMRRNGRENVCE